MKHGIKKQIFISSDNIDKDVDFKINKQKITFTSIISTKLLNESLLGLL